MKKQQIDQVVEILQAVNVLHQGGVIAYPTEAVYGLGCDPQNLSAVKKILELKQRQKEKGLILVASDLQQLKPYLLSLDKNIEEKILADYPHAITWLVPAKKTVSEYLKGQFDTLAVRISEHPIVHQLCEKFGGAIVSTSANISKQESAREAEQVKNIFGDNVDYIVEGKTNYNVEPSEIRDVLTNQIIRKN